MIAWLEHVRRKRLAVPGVGVALVLIAWVLCSLFRPHRDLVAEALRQQGYPVSLSGLDAWYPSVPSSENAALVYTNAFGLLTHLAGPNGSFTSALPPIGQRLSDGEERALKDCLAQNQPALRLLHSIPDSARSRYPVRLGAGFTVVLTHLAGTKEAVALLSAEGLMHAHHGDAERATRAFLAAGRVAESMGEEPLIVSQLVRFSDWGILLPRLERALSLTTFTDSQLTALQKLVAVAERPQSMAKSMVIERAVGLSAFAEYKTMPMLVPQPQTWGGHARDWGETLVLYILRMAGWKTKDKAFYCDTMAKHIAVLELAYPARAAAGAQMAASTNAPNRFFTFSLLLLPSLVKVYSKEANHVANVRVAAAALAVERFRLAHTNALPATLDLLAPSCCETVPTDPFDGQQLRYKTHGSSYVVYSVGSDGRDDGGVVWDPTFTKVPTDVTFVVKH
jgi:hypothetical protein